MKKKMKKDESDAKEWAEKSQRTAVDHSTTNRLYTRLPRPMRASGIEHSPISGACAEPSKNDLWTDGSPGHAKLPYLFDRSNYKKITVNAWAFDVMFFAHVSALQN